MSGPGASERFVITADTRRRWSDEEKRAIVGEAARTTTSVSGVARRHGIAPGLLFRWRREFAEADGERELPPPAPVFIPIALPAPANAAAGPARRSGMIEIELVGGRRIRVDAAVDVDVLKRVVDALEGR
jgi:transposase